MKRTIIQINPSSAAKALLGHQSSAAFLAYAKSDLAE
jgi:hypothetical protein